LRCERAAAKAARFFCQSEFGVGEPEEEAMSKTTGRFSIAVIAVLMVANWFHARQAKASSQGGYR
jgi:hypothetical protein